MKDARDTLDQLHRQFPSLTFQHNPGAPSPWEARLCAETPERLRDLVGGALQAEAQLDAEEAARHLRALRGRLEAAGFEVTSTAEAPSALAITAPATCGPRPTEMIVCRRRPDDGARMWLFTDDGEPLAEADQITNAVVAITGHLAAQARARTA